MHHLTEFVLPPAGVHYWVGGQTDKPTVLLLHGATMNHHMFDAQIEVLVDDYHVVTCDFRGHGASQPLTQPFTLADCADDVIAILDQLGVNQAVLVGQSMGGYIAQDVYRRYPQRVSAMVMVDSLSTAVPYAKWEILVLKATLPLFNLWPYTHLVRTIAQATAIKLETQAYALNALKQIDKAAFLSIWKAVTLTINEIGFPGHQIRVPLLITHGDQDSRGNIRKQAPTWAASEPDARLVVIPNAGHNANQDNPDFFNRVLLEFLAQGNHEPSK